MMKYRVATRRFGEFEIEAGSFSTTGGMLQFFGERGQSIAVFNYNDWASVQRADWAYLQKAPNKTASPTPVTPQPTPPQESSANDSGRSIAMDAAMGDFAGLGVPGGIDADIT